MEITDIFNDDAFSIANMSRAFSEIDHVPSRAGALAFAGVQEAETSETVAVEIDSETLGVIPTRERGAPATQVARDKRKLVPLPIPHIPSESRITAGELLGLRRYGEVTVETVKNVVDARMEKMARQHDMTLENLRLGALMGQIRDADGSVLVDLFNALDVAAPDVVDFDLENDATEVEVECTKIGRSMRDAAKMLMPSGAMVHSFCGDEFFDKLRSHPEIKADRRSFEEGAKRKLEDDYAYGSMMIGGILFENYRGSDNAGVGKDTAQGGAVGIPTGSARFFWTGVPGMYMEALAPGDFIDAVVEPGLPRYARSVVDPEGKYVKLMTEQNPLPICLRPATLMTATA